MNATKLPTRQQGRVLAYIEDYIEEHAFAPTVREIAFFLTSRKAASPNAVMGHLHALKKKGYLTWVKNKSRTLHPLRKAPRDGMTVEIKITCSRCGCHLVEDRLVLEVRAGHLRQRKPALDLCDSCYRALELWLKVTGGANKPIVPLPGQKALFAETLRDAEEHF